MGGHPDDGDSADRARRSFGRLLDWHLNVHGTRPNGSPDRPGRKWSQKEFAGACRVSDKTVRNWTGDKNPPIEMETIENTLFGNDVTRYAAWRLELRQAYAAAGDTPRNSADIKRLVTDAERQTISRALSRLHNGPAVVILAQDQEGLGSAAVVREIRTQAIGMFGDKAVHSLSPSYLTAEDGVAPYFESLLAQLDLPTADASPLNFQLRLAQRLKGGEPMGLLFTGIERSPPEALKSLCGALRALNDRHGEPRILMCGGERLCDMRYANGALSYLSHAQEEHWPDPDAAEIVAEASALDCGSLDPGLIELLQELTGGHAELIRELLHKVKAGEGSRDALTRAVFDSPAIWRVVAPLLADSDAASYLRSIVDREELGKAQPYIFNVTLRRLFWRNLIKRQPSGDDVRLVWRSPAIREAVRQILRSSHADDVV